MDSAPTVEGGSPSGITLYHGLNTRVYVPERTAVPLQEGIHLKIDNLGKRSSQPKDILSRFLLGLGTAKVVAESSHTRDLWANTRIEHDGEVSVYGRVAQEKTSWRKPVDMVRRETGTTNTLHPYYNENTLVRLLGKYLPKWEQLRSRISLFTDKTLPIETFLKADEANDRLWTNGKIEVKLMKAFPWQHTPGLHFIVAPTEAYQRQWQTVIEPTGGNPDSSPMYQSYLQTTLECAALSLAIQELIGPNEGEIHNSGNWTEGFLFAGEKSDIGNVNIDRILQGDIVGEKREHFTRFSIGTDGNIHPVERYSQGFGKKSPKSHFHLYMPPNGAVVDLPSMWPWEAYEKMDEARKASQPTNEFEEVINKWKKVYPATESQMRKKESFPTLSQEQLDVVNQKLGNGKLTKLISSERYKGSLA